MSDTTLDEILGSPSVHDLPDGPEDAPDDAETDASETQAADADSQEPETGADGDDDEIQDFEPSELKRIGLEKALKAERGLRRIDRKRAGELQRQIDQLTGQMSALRPQTQAQAPATQKPDDEYDQFLADAPKYTKSVVEKEIGALRREAALERIADSQADYIEKHEDAAELFAKFRGYAAEDPALAAQFRAIADRKHPRHRNPGKFAYEYAKARVAAEEMGDPVAYREKVRAELLAESGSVEKPPRTLVRSPKTIASARGSGARHSAAWAGPTSLDDVLSSPRRSRG